ncbi:hypothetical protein L2K70_16385 [Nocardioides KLBMP 9356]|uniref:Uncharacterized protein n=1 Tax=Nocardioides potassii TaxID=2911371 RepID=A0ABS9HGB9_9ACTN|nr:hypothetical protein [Nocardioides potassii]MCF6379191.1 hypothetical protein [Nocardioides potassii]
MTPPAIEAGPPDPTADDPMLRVLRERHPEVDIVVLPQNAPAPVAPVLTADERDALAVGVERLLDDLLARLALGDRTATREGRWHTDEWDQTWYEAVAVVEDLGRGENVTLLRSTGNALVGLGWQARPVPGDRPRLVARRRGGFEAAATVRPTALVVTVRTAKVRAAEGAAG